MNGDLISRKALMDEIKKSGESAGDGLVQMSRDTMICLMTIAHFPAVETVTVVRCRECKYEEICCRNIRSNGHNPDEFCSFGVRADMESAPTCTNDRNGGAVRAADIYAGHKSDSGNADGGAES